MSDAFQTLCGPGQSTVDSADLQSALAASGISNRNPELSQMIGSINGPIDAAKFSKLTGTVKSKAFAREEQSQIFAAFDDAEKGAIDLEAFSTSIQTLGFHLPEDEVRALFDEADVNGDGKITEADWLATMGKSTLV